MQIEPFEYFLGARQHALMLVLAGLRRRDRNQFDFCKLMLADHAAGIAASRARFGAEAWRQRGQPHRQFFFIDDRFADEIGQRDFGGGNETETFGLQSFIGRREQLSFDGPELVVLEFRQLARAEHHIVAHQQWRIDLGVTMLTGMEVEHELSDRTLQPRQSLLQHHEARATQFRSSLEIHVAKRATEVVMRLRREGIVADLAVDVALHVAVLVYAFGHIVERQVRNRCKLFRQLLVGRLGCLLELRHRRLELGDFRHKSVGARLVLGLLGLADFLRSRIAPRLRLLGGQDRRTAFFVDRQQPSRQRRQPAAFSPASKAWGLSRIDLMSCMRGNSWASCRRCQRIAFGI